jgi:hypothetical protein
MDCATAVLPTYIYIILLDITRDPDAISKDVISVEGYVSATMSDRCCQINFLKTPYTKLMKTNQPSNDFIFKSEHGSVCLCKVPHRYLIISRVKKVMFQSVQSVRITTPKHFRDYNAACRFSIVLGCWRDLCLDRTGSSYLMHNVSSHTYSNALRMSLCD